MSQKCNMWKKNEGTSEICQNICICHWLYISASEFENVNAWGLSRKIWNACHGLKITEQLIKTGREMLLDSMDLILWLRYIIWDIDLDIYCMCLGKGLNSSVWGNWITMLKLFNTITKICASVWLQTMNEKFSLKKIISS